ncbi:aldo/keto reductase [Paraburkholderia rhizosphaerae]|uniref:aldo/keto reductase n=1 Tax=Paraburkholderia rhizosphaerae TaxID=480658 RepID=UPI001066A570
MIAAVESLGIGFVAYSPPGKGFLTGAVQTDTRFHTKTTSVLNLPRFSVADRVANLALVESLKAFSAQQSLRSRSRGYANKI